MEIGKAAVEINAINQSMEEMIEKYANIRNADALRWAFEYLAQQLAKKRRIVEAMQR